GTLTKWQTLPPNGSSPVALFSQWGAESIGPWGDALLLWSKADFHGFTIEPSSTDESFCPNARPPIGNPAYPPCKWRETSNTFWAKRPSVLQSASTGGTFVDIDGDGLADRVSALPEQVNGYQKASVLLSRRIPYLQSVDGIAGPALLPF